MVEGLNGMVGLKLERMSKNIVGLLTSFNDNEGIMRLVYNDVSNPLETELKIDKKKVRNPNSKESRIKPYPFDFDTTQTDGVSIRAYYNYGELNSNETVAESDLHIDIIVNKKLWLINSKVKGVPESLVRPYEIMSRVVEVVGRSQPNTTKRFKVNGFQHLSINADYDALRLYLSYFSVETRHA